MTLGLFPLNLVVFPHTQLPLHVFEPRYRALISECISNNSTFGINLVVNGHLHSIGCETRVVEVTERFSDGRMDIIVEGQSRYQILEVNETNQPYAVAEIEPIKDEIIPVDPTLVSDCTDLHNQVVRLVYGEDTDIFNPENLGDRAASYLLAPKAGLTFEQKQKLMELTNENTRLELLRDHLTEIVPTVRRAELVQRVIKSDGYLPATED